MRASDQKPASTVPSAPVFSDKQSGAAFTVPEASRAVFITEGVNEIQGTHLITQAQLDYNTCLTKEQS